MRWRWRPDLLWGICIVLVYWLGRAFFLTGRGEMRGDPVVFAITDRISMLAGGVDRASLPNKAIVTRQRPDGSGVIAVRIDLDKAKRDNSENIRLVQGDTVSVEETVASYMRGLLRGAVRLGVGASVSPVYGF